MEGPHPCSAFHDETGGVRPPSDYRQDGFAGKGVLVSLMRHPREGAKKEEYRSKAAVPTFIYALSEANIVPTEAGTDTGDGERHRPCMTTVEQNGYGVKGVYSCAFTTKGHQTKKGLTTLASVLRS